MSPPTESPTRTDQTVILCGLGRVGWRVLESLRAAGQTVVVVDIRTPSDDPRLVGVKVVTGDCRRADVLEQAGVKTARGIMVLASDDMTNVTTAMLVRRLNPSARIVIRMFNQNLLTRIGAAVKNTIALSVSALTAPMLAMTAATGDVLGAFKLDSGPQQVSELVVKEGSDLAGRSIGDVAGQYRLLPLAYVPVGGTARFLLDVHGDSRLAPGDRLVFSGAPAELRPLLEKLRGAILPGVMWAGAVRRWVRTAGRALGEVDLAVKIITPILLGTVFVSTLIFWSVLGTTPQDGLYRTVSVISTGSDLHGEDQPKWAKVFLSILKLAGAALVAGFTAILTNYLIRARLGGAFEVRRVPDGGHVVVCGLGNVGYRCVEELTGLGERVVVIDRMNDNAFIATCRRKGVPTFVGDATMMEVLRHARVDTAKAVIAATESDLANLEIALLVRELNPAQRVVVRLADPQFADAVRESADIQYAASVPTLAAPAFAAALFGDRVQTLITAVGRALVVVEVVVQADDACLNGPSLRAAVVDYRLLPVSLNGIDPATVPDRRLKPGDRLIAVAELPDLERLLRREPAPREWGVVVSAYPVTAKDVLVPLVRAARHCHNDEAEKVLAAGPFRVAVGQTRGEAEELQAKLSRERVTVQIVRDEPPR